MKSVVLGVILALSLCYFVQCELVEGKNEGKGTATLGTTLKPTPAVTTTEAPKNNCARHNASCQDCLKEGGPTCYFCHKTNVCADYPYKSIFPMEECGKLGDMAWGVCWVNFEILLIVCGVLLFLIIMSITICCCCCCRKRGVSIWAKDQAKYEQQRQELKVRSDDRKKDRQSRTDEIRRKYGLVLDASGLMKDETPYQRFDA